MDMTNWHPDTPPEYMDSIVTGDARLLAERIPDESVDLVFTDPLYDRMGDYQWLAQTSVRVLKRGGAVLVWGNGKWHRENANWLVGAGLTWRYEFTCVHHSGGSPMCGKVIAKANRLTWLDVDSHSRMIDYLADGYLSMPWSGPTEWRWTKNPKFTAQAIRAFCDVGATVFDPFTGGGTVPAVCKMLGRHYVAFEIDPETAERARERVLLTQPPLFVHTEQQQAMAWDTEALPSGVEDSGQAQLWEVERV